MGNICGPINFGAAGGNAAEAAVDRATVGGDDTSGAVEATTIDVTGAAVVDVVVDELDGAPGAASGTLGARGVGEASAASAVKSRICKSCTRVSSSWPVRPFASRVCALAADDVLVQSREYTRSHRSGMT